MKGEVTDVILGTVTALVTVKVGNDVIESVITKHSAEELKLQKGDKVTAVKPSASSIEIDGVVANKLGLTASIWILCRVAA